jgi:hypothetical protein
MAALGDRSRSRRSSADLEGAPCRSPGRRFDAVLVTNYLWRPLFAEIVAAARRGGVLSTRPSPPATRPSAGRPGPTFCSPAVNF